MRGSTREHRAVAFDQRVVQQVALFRPGLDEEPGRTVPSVSGIATRVTIGSL